MRPPPVRETRDFWALLSTDAGERLRACRGVETPPLESSVNLIRSQELRNFSTDARLQAELVKSELRVAREAVLVEVFQHPSLWSADGFSDAEAALTSPANTVTFLSELFVSLSDEWTQTVRASRAKDEIRGAQVCDDYGSTHSSCDDDAVCARVDAVRSHMQQVVTVTVKTVCSS